MNGEEYAGEQTNVFEDFETIINAGFRLMVLIVRIFK